MTEHPAPDAVPSTPDAAPDAVPPARNATSDVGPDPDERSPLRSRYASAAMRAIWSGRRRFGLWRRLWLALAESQQSLGLPITDEQVEALRANLDTVDFEAAAVHERRLRHDVMAHVHALGDQAPAARPIIHLGTTSQFVNCNAELIQMRDGLNLVLAKTARLIGALGDFARDHRALPTLGLTHYQPAQPVTVGKRAAVWAMDLALCLEDLEHRRATLRFRGVKGTTGTQASFLALFDGDHDKVERLDELVAEHVGWPVEARLPVTGQTYPRVVDALVVSSLAALAAAMHKCATDLRLLAGRKEIEEPFEADQIGSSAMAYKRNPMRCERTCGLARYVMTLAQSPLDTAATQWMERTLDDSANRRLVIADAFLATDACLELLTNVVGGLVVHERVIAANLAAELPFMATENLMMAAVRAGADRQAAHEVIRRHSVEAGRAIKDEGRPNDLLDRLAADPLFSGIDVHGLLDPAAFIGRAPEQVDRFLADVVEPIRARYAAASLTAAEVRV